MKRSLVCIFTLFFSLCLCLPAFTLSSGRSAVVYAAEPSETSYGDHSSYYLPDDLGEGPDISADSALVMDVASGAVLYSRESDTKRYPASITKVMTALLVLENCDLNEIVTFSSEAVNGIEAGSSSAGINVGAELTVEDTLYALMLVSANEAAAALAEHVSGSQEAFADLMNSRAKELGCTGTHFVNPHGLPDEDHYTTAHDMGLILKEALKHDDFRRISGALSYTLEESDTLTDTIELWNHAKILFESSEYYYEYCEGAKTGFTQAAGNTLVSYAKKDDVELLCIILKDYSAANSYYDSENLFNWAFDKVKTITPLSSYDLDNGLEKSGAFDETALYQVEALNCSFPQDYTILVNSDFDKSVLKRSFVYDENAEAGTLGAIQIYAGDTLIGSAPVTFDTTTDQAKTYLGTAAADGSGNGDDLETAPVDTNRMTPGKLLRIVLIIVIIIVVILLILMLIRRSRRKRRNRRRRRRTSSDSESSQTRRTSSGSDSTGTRRSSSDTRSSGRNRRHR